jgi:hypothetical protein
MSAAGTVRGASNAAPVTPAAPTTTDQDQHVACLLECLLLGNT